MNASADENINNSIIKGISQKIFNVKGTPLAIIKIVITSKFMVKLIKAEKDPETTITYRGKDSFLSRSPLPTIAETPLFVTSTK